MAITASEKSNLLGVTSFMFNFAPDNASFARMEAILEANGNSFYNLGTQLANTSTFTSQFEGLETTSEKIGLILGRLGLEEGSLGYTRGEAFITQKLEQGTPVGQVLMEIGEIMLRDPEDVPEGLEGAAATLQNKITVANSYLESGLEGYSNDTLPGLLEGVDETQASVDSAQSAIDSAEPGTPGDTFSLTEDTDTIVASDYELAEGETEEDVVRSSDGDETFNGVASALSSARTLDADDSIDGGAGNDTLNVDVQGNFSGFSDEGGVTNVENVALTNEGTINRSFSAEGVEGDVNYTVNAGEATVNLSDIDSAAGSVTLNDQASGKFSIDYTTEAVKGNEDNFDLNLNNVGTVEDTDADVEEAAVGVTADGVESATVAVTGDNVVDLAKVSATDYTVEGAGNLNVTEVAKDLSSFDASALAGDLDLAVNTNDARKNATIAGGEGNDTVTFSGNNTVKYTMAGVENVVLAGGNTTFAASDISGVETITASGAMTGDATFAGLGNADLALNIEKDAEGVTLDNSGTTTINVDDAAATADKTVAVDGDATLTKSSAAVVNVAENIDFTGTLTAQNAESVNLTVDGAVNGATVNASKASAVEVSGVAEDSTLDLQAAKAEQLTVNAAADLDLSVSTLTGLESLNATTEGKLTVGDLAKINTVNVNGTGEADLGNLGDAGQDGYGITVNAGSLSDTGSDDVALKTGTINTKGTDITVNAADVLDGVTLGNINADNSGENVGDVTLDLSNVGGNIQLDNVTGDTVTVNAGDALGTLSSTGTITGDNVTINGAGLGTNNADIVGTGKSFTGVLNGGIEGDNYTVNLSNAELSEFNLSGDLDLGSDELTVDLTSNITDDEVEATYNVKGVEDLTFKMADGSDTVKLSSNSSLAGTTSLTVNTGTLDVSALSNASDFNGITNVSIASGLTLTAAQLGEISSGALGSDSSGDLNVKVSSKEEAEAVAQLVSDKATGSNVKVGVVVSESADQDVKDAVDQAVAENGFEKIEEKSDGSTETGSTAFEDSINNLFTVPTDGSDVAGVEQAAGDGYDVVTANGGDLDISPLKQDSNGSGASGKETTLDLSDVTIGGDVSVKLAEINEEGNKGDFDVDGDSRISDQTIKLPELSDIDGQLTVENMTIASAANVSGENKTVSNQHTVEFASTTTAAVGDSISFFEKASPADAFERVDVQITDTSDGISVELLDGSEYTGDVSFAESSGTLTLTAAVGSVVSNGTYRPDDRTVTNDVLDFGTTTETDFIGAIDSISVADDGEWADVTMDFNDGGSLVLDNLAKFDTFNSIVESEGTDVTSVDAPVTEDVQVAELVGIIGDQGTFTFGDAVA